MRTRISAKRRKVSSRTRYDFRGLTLQSAIILKNGYLITLFSRMTQPAKAKYTSGASVGVPGIVSP